jgi:hypothetical protein
MELLKIQMQDAGRVVATLKAAGQVKSSVAEPVDLCASSPVSTRPCSSYTVFTKQKFKFFHGFNFKYRYGICSKRLEVKFIFEYRTEKIGVVDPDPDWIRIQ